MRTWSCSSARIQNQFERWADNLASAFVRLEPTHLSSQPFRGRIAQVSSGDLKVSQVTASAHRVERLPAHIAASAEDTCFLNLQLHGVGLTRQGGRACTTRPMDMAVVRTAEPFSIDHADNFSLYSITINRTDLPADLLDRQTLSLSGSPASREIWKLLQTTARLSLSPGTAKSAARNNLSSYFSGLIHLAVDLESDRPVDAVQRSVRLDMVLDYIANNLTARGLGAAMIARSLGISTRYLHRIFEPTGCTVSDHINKMRLAASAKALRNWRHRRISAIAYAHGYQDLSYFNRRFKQAYGETPGQYRARHKENLGSL
ncbi:MAG: helix-turn-helix domain-containing protein [Pseudomonadota bacterium]